MAGGLSEGRFSRQAKALAALGASQETLSGSFAAVLGAGALGCAFATQLARMGFAGMRIADFDVVEEVNLHRQILFDESDIGRPKAATAAEKVRAANHSFAAEAFPEKVDDSNFARFARGASIVFDASDSVEARYMMDAQCRAAGIPLVITAVAGTSGIVIPVARGGASLLDVFPERPGPDDVANVKSHGVFPPVVQLAAAIALAQGVKILSGAPPRREIFRFDAAGICRPVSLPPPKGALSASSAK